MKYALSHGLWGQTASPALAQPSLAVDLHCDVAIIGAGYTGLSAALHLAERGLSAVVLEAETVGFGGSGRNVGLVNAGMWVMPDTLKQVLGADLGGRMLSFLGEGPAEVFGLVDRYGITCEAQRAGTLHCAVGAKGLDEINLRAAQWRQLNAPVEVLSSASAAEKLAATPLPERCGIIAQGRSSRLVMRVGWGARPWGWEPGFTKAHRCPVFRKPLMAGI